MWHNLAVQTEGQCFSSLLLISPWSALSSGAVGEARSGSHDAQRKSFVKVAECRCSSLRVCPGRGNQRFSFRVQENAQNTPLHCEIPRVLAQSPGASSAVWYRTAEGPRENSARASSQRVSPRVRARV